MISDLRLDKATMKEMNSFENRWKRYTRNERVVYLRSRGIELDGRETGDKLILLAMGKEIEAPEFHEMQAALQAYRDSTKEHKPVKESGVEEMKRPELMKMASEKGLTGFHTMKNDELKEALRG